MLCPVLSLREICSSNADCSSARYSSCHSPCYDDDTYTWNAKAEELSITGKLKERRALLQIEAQRQKMLDDSRRQRQRAEQKALEDRRDLEQRQRTRRDLEQRQKMLDDSRRQRQRDEERQKRLEARFVSALLTINFARATGSIDTIVAYGQNVGKQTKMVLRTDWVDKEVVYISQLGFQLEDITATLVVGKGEQQATYTCKVPVLLLNKDEDKQWKQLCKAKTDLRVQIQFVMRKTGVGGGTAFAINDIRVTVPQVEKTEL